MPKLSDLGLTNEQVGENIDYGSIPDQMGAFAPLPQPGTYRFKFPTKLDDLWEVFDHPNGQPPGKRIRANFDDSHPLLIIQSPGGEKDGEPFTTRISNAERPRGKKTDPVRPNVSDMDYVLRDVFAQTAKPKDREGRIGTNPAYAQTFMQLAAGQEMTADVEWNWFCNPKKNIYVSNGQGGFQEVQGQVGCNTTYYQGDVDKIPSNPDDPNSPKVFPERVGCQCGASVRAFANLTRFRK